MSEAGAQKVEPRSARLLAALYDSALLLGAGLALPWLAFRMLTRKRYREGLLERLTMRLPPPRGERTRIWVHAASAGEMVAALALVAEIERRLPRVEVVLSSTTTSGLEVASRRLPERVRFLLPLDSSPLVRRVLTRVDPDLLVLVELELWPSLTAAAAARGVALAVANGRISARSSRRYRWWPASVLVGFRRVAAYAVQNEEYRARLLALGVPEERIAVTGNMKADLATESNAARDAQRSALGVPPAAPVIVAGSTHAGEEAALAHAARDLGAVLVIAPRHRERLAAAEKEIAGAGLVPLRLTQLRAAPRALAPGEALVVDTMGELSRIYAAADVAFVGGTLFPGVGGHNVFEPVLAGAPVVVGRHVANVRSDVDHLAAAGALERVDDPAGLGAALRAALGPLGAARRTAASGAAAAARGSAARTFEFIARRALRDVPAGATTSLDPHERTQHG